MKYFQYQKDREWHALSARDRLSLKNPYSINTCNSRVVPSLPLNSHVSVFKALLIVSGSKYLSNTRLVVQLEQVNASIWAFCSSYAKP